MRASYLIRQRFRYAYPGPIHDLHHRLIVAPPLLYGDQRRLRHDLTVTPPIGIRWDDDPFGNSIATIEAEHVDEAVEFVYEATIERIAGELPKVAARWLDDPRYRSPSTLTVPSSALRDAAAWLLISSDDPYTLAERINDFVAYHMRYVAGATSVMTTAAEAYAQATGVCQDYAHIMVALARACGLAARYVSGHLIGEGGTHAWVEVLGPSAEPGSAVVWAFDPTHRRRTNLDYVFVAAGRDFADVTPTSGRFVAPYIGEFTTDRSVDLVNIEYAA